MGRLICSGCQVDAFSGSVRAAERLRRGRKAAYDPCLDDENRTLYFLIEEWRAVPVFFGFVYTFFRKRKKKQDNHFFTKPEDML